MTKLSLAVPAIVFALVFNVSFAVAQGEDVKVNEDFESGADNWKPTDPTVWKVTKIGGRTVYSQHKKKSSYKPPHRSPYHISLLRDVVVSDFTLDVEVLSTHPDYGHRDACLFFGYQDPAHFYYVHLGKKTDPNSNQIMIVNDAPRTKISTKTTPGTNWDDKWHSVRIIRKVEDGTIEIYFDDMDTPALTAKDDTFKWGQIGLGTFDDTTAWDNLKLEGKKGERD